MTYCLCGSRALKKVFEKNKQLCCDAERGIFIDYCTEVYCSYYSRMGRNKPPGTPIFPPTYGRKPLLNLGICTNNCPTYTVTYIPQRTNLLVPFRPTAGTGYEGDAVRSTWLIDKSQNSTVKVC